MAFLSWVAGGGGGGSGTVTTVSVATAHGFSGTVANPTTTPAITLSETVSGLLKGSGGSLAAATAADVPGVGGVTVTGTPTTGEVLTATSGSAADWQAASGGSPPAVVITTAGATFQPSVTLAAGSTATVSWASPGFTTQTGLTPTLSFGSAATRTVYMSCADSNGYNALDQIVTFNLGFLNTDDQGISSLPSSYNWPAQAVSAVAGVNQMTGLIVFAAANINVSNVGVALGGTLDFTGMGQLQHIECFKSQVQQVYTSGCNSLIRFCLELNNLTTLNLNTLEPNILDVRAASQTGLSLALAPQAISALNDWHFCIRDQVITNMPNFVTQYPVLQQLWIWNTRQSGTIQTASGGTLYSIEAESNDYTTASLTNQFTTQRDGNGNTVTPNLDLRANMLATCTLTGCTDLGNIALQDNAFSQSTVNGIVTTVDGFATSNGTLNLQGNPDVSGAGATSKANLIGRGWTVTTGAGPVAVVQTATGSSLGGTTFGSGTTLHNTVFLIVGTYTNSSGALSSSSPLLGGSPVTGATALFNNGGINGIASPFNAGTGVYVTIWMLPNVGAGLTSVGLTIGGGGGVTGVAAYEVSGLTTTPTLDIHSSGSSATSTAVDAGFSLETASGGEIVFGLAQIYAQSLAGPGAPWTNVSPGGGPTWAGYRFCNSAGEAFHWQQTAEASNPWVAGLVTVA